MRSGSSTFLDDGACGWSASRPPATAWRPAGGDVHRGSPGAFQAHTPASCRDGDGQTIESHSISAGLDYPGVGPGARLPEDIGRAEYRPVTDTEAMDALRLLSHREGIIPAIESAHAVAGALTLGRELGDGSIIVVNLSGRGRQDVDGGSLVRPVRHAAVGVQTPPDSPKAAGSGR